MIIYLGADHAGFILKEHIKKFLLTKKIQVHDLGAHTLKKDDDYPDYAFLVARSVAASKESARGILICGSAEGICIAANKIKGIRAVPVWTEYAAKQTREHTDANILCLGGGQTIKKIPTLSFSKIKKIINIFLITPFSTEPRHKRRILKIQKEEEKEKKRKNKK